MDTKALRQEILDLAIHGKLVPQDPNDEPASVLLERIKAEKERLIKEGKIKRSKKSAKSSDTPHYENVPFEVPSSWVWTNIEELFFVTKLAGFEYTDCLTKDTISSNNEVPIVRAQNVRMGYFVENTNEAISEALSQQLERSALTKKCLLMTFIGAGIGDTCIFPALKRCHLAPNVAKIEPYSNKIDLKYALYYLMSDLGQLGVRGISKSTAQPSLSMATIRSLEIALPPLAEQHRIVAEIEKLFELIDQIEQGKADLQTIIKQTKSKILDLAIHGKLVPQDPNDEPAIELLKRINPDFTPCDNGHYSSMIANGYYDYTNTNPRNGYVSGTNHQNPSLIINGGTFAGGLNTIKNDDGARLVINDGTFTNMSQATVQNHHVTEIKGGTFNTTGSAQYVVDNEGHNGAANDLGQMTISGGTLNGKIYVVGAGASLAVTGGTFSDPSALLYLSGNANVKIRLNGDATCNGFKTQSGQSVELDLNNHVLTLAKPTVGSAGTETNSCQLLKGSTVTMKNGTLASDNDKIMIQNYCNLTLDAMTVRGLNALYVLSNNCGNILINNTTINAGTGAYAFDVCGYSTYTDGVKVTVKGTSIINGNVELSKSTGNTEPMELNIEGGTFNGNLVVDSSITDASSIINVTGTPSFKGTGWDSYIK